MFFKESFITLHRNAIAVLISTFASMGIAQAQASGPVGETSSTSAWVSVSTPALYRISNVSPFEIDQPTAIEAALTSDSVFESNPFEICVWTNDSGASDTRIKFYSYMVSYNPGVAASNEFLMSTGISGQDPIKYGLKFNGADPNTHVATVDAAPATEGVGLSDVIDAEDIFSTVSSNCSNGHNRSIKITIAADQLRLMIPTGDYHDILEMTLGAF